MGLTVDILRLSSNEAVTVIKSRFRTLAMKFHPDRGGDANKFMAMNEAHEYLLRTCTGWLYSLSRICTTGMKIGEIEYEPTSKACDIHVDGKPLADQFHSCLQKSTISIDNPFDKYRAD
jgi:hypothetical protein